MKKYILFISIMLLCFSSIKLEAKNINPDVLEFNFGNICVGDTKVLEVTFQNVGDYSIKIFNINDTQEFIKLQKLGFSILKNIITFSPNKPPYPPGFSKASLEIEFTPNKYCFVFDTIKLPLLYQPAPNIFLPANDTLIVVIKGQGIENNILSTPAKIKDKLETNMLKEYSINLTSNSINATEITSAVIKPETEHITFNILNTFPMYLEGINYEPGNKETITFTATADTEITYSGYIQLNLKSEIGGCINKITIPINIDFVVVHNELKYKDNKGNIIDNINHYIICNNQTVYDTIYVSNTLPYTFVSLKFSDTTSQYSIVQCPALPLKVNEEEKLEIIVSNTMSNEGISNNALIFEMQDDADNRITFDTISFQHELKKSDISASDTNINFGILETCDEPPSQQIEFINNGSLADTLYIDTYNISEYYNLDKNIIILPANSKEVLNIDFIPSKVSNIPNYDTTKIIIHNTACPKQLDINLYSIVEDINIAINPKIIDFGEVKKNQVVSKEIEIQNNSPFDVYLKQLDFMPNLYFTTNIQFPIAIEKNKTIRIPIYFSAPEENIYNCTLYLTLGRSCKINDSITLTAVTIPETELTFRISKHDKVSPNLTNYDIPIYLKSNYTKDSLIIENIELELDRTLFYPKKVNTGRLNTEIDNNKRIINISDININHINADEETELCRIRGDVLLGEADSTSIIIRDIKTLQESKYLIQNGYLTIETCTQGGNRLINYGYNPNIRATNNPVANDIINVECDIIEQGKHYLSIVNYLGKETIVKCWDIQDRNINKLFFSIPVNDLCSGTYILVLTTPVKKYSTNIVIAR